MFNMVMPSLAAVPQRFGPSSAEVTLQIESATTIIEARLRTLELACAGLWRLLKEKHGYTDEELVESIQAIDAADGVVDGKIGNADVNCPNCHRKQLVRHPIKCCWCGVELPHSPM